MRKWLALSWVLMLIGIVCVFKDARAQNKLLLLYVASSCSQASSLLARLDGGQNSSAVTTAVCGMVTDGSWSVLDGLYVYAINSQANALVNWVNAAYNGTISGVPTFSANQGITGCTSCWISTAFNPSTAGGQWAVNSMNLGSCVVTSRSVSNNWATMGLNDGTQQSYIQPLITSALNYGLNISSAALQADASSNAQGSWIVSRTGSTTSTAYLNGASDGTDSTASLGLTNATLFTFAYSNANSPLLFYQDQLAYSLWGGGLTAAQANSIYSRLHTYLQTVGETTAC